MKPKNTLILLVLALGLFAFIRFYESKLPTTREAEDRSKHVVAFDAGNITGISITNNEEKIELSKQGLQWRLTAPVKDRADSQIVNQLLTGMEILSVDSSFEADGKSGEKTSLQDLGLDTSNVRLRFLGKDAPPEILFGKDAAVDGKMYVRLDGSKTVYVVNNELKTLVQRKTDDFRDRRLLDFDAGHVERLSVKTDAGEIEATKEHDGWLLEKPLKARGDSQKITDLIAQTINTRIDAFLPENGTSLTADGLNEPRGTIKLTTGDTSKPALLQIGLPTEKDKDKVYAKLSSRESIYMLSSKIEGVLNIKPNDIRDRHLLKLNLDVVDRIHIDASGKPEIVLARKLEDWTLRTSGDAPANAALVRAFVSGLQNQQVTAFVADVSSDLPNYGLDKPSVRVTFSSYASENTAESKAGENPFLTVSFGRVEGDVVYACLENEPYVVSVPKNILVSILTDPVEWQDLAIYKFKPEEITSLEIIRDGQTLAFNRSGSAWKLLKGTGMPGENAIESLENALSSLRAVRWTGSSTAGLGFEKPSLAIGFTTAGKKSGMLTVGSANAEGMWNGEAEGRPGAFLISKPDYEALHAPLTEAMTPAPSAAPSSTPASVK